MKEHKRIKGRINEKEKKIKRIKNV